MASESDPKVCRRRLALHDDTVFAKYKYIVTFPSINVMIIVNVLV